MSDPMKDGPTRVRVGPCSLCAMPTTRAGMCSNCANRLVIIEVASGTSHATPGIWRQARP